MCLATVYVDMGDGQKEEVMQDVAFIEFKRQGFLLTTILGEEKAFPAGSKVRNIDLLNGSMVIDESESSNP
jgi:predicted RNA-binding protein